MFNDPVTADTIYDIASLTKVVSTTSAVMKLYEEGKLSLDATIADFIPEAVSNGKGKITVKNLLLHNSGLPDDYPFDKWGYQGVTKKKFMQWLNTCELAYPTGTATIYSDLSMVFLAEII